MAYQQQSIITRKARIWPDIPRETVTLPAPPGVTNAANPLILIIILFGTLGLACYAFIFSLIPDTNKLFFVALLFISGLMALSSLTTFLYQWIPARRRLKRLQASYLKQVYEVEHRLRTLAQQERQGRIELDPPFVLPDEPSPLYDGISIIPLIQRSFTNQDIHLWARKSDDPDFLRVRIGMGNCSPTFKLDADRSNPASDTPMALVRMHDRVEELVVQYASMILPITVSLKQHGPIAITGTAHSLAQARALAYAIVCQIVYHHSPEDVRIIVLAPEAQAAAWEWAMYLPHTVVYEPGQPITSTKEAGPAHAVAIGAEAIVHQLPLISRELARRALLLDDTRHAKASPTLPQLVIIVDHFDSIDDLDQPTVALPSLILDLPYAQTNGTTHNRTRLSATPLKRPEMTLALHHGPSLNVSVLCVCGDKADIPTTAGVMIDLDLPSSLSPATSSGQPESREIASLLLPQEVTQERIRMLSPAPSSSVICDHIDIVPFDGLRYFALRLQALRSLTTTCLEIRTQVDLRTLFEPPLDLSTYVPMARWNDPTFRSPTGAPLMRIPIGLKIGDETQFLDFTKDGPHGLLIGQTGSGKSELLQTIIAALAVTYRPTEVNFLLIDYQAGLALEPFRSLPHTIGFLSNLASPVLLQRFITMLRAEATRRELCWKEGKVTPRLLIIIDGFAEMTGQVAMMLDELFTIARADRAIGMHLLLSAQRFEGMVAAKIRDYVQYRLCLRCASNEDSREVLRRVDAARLPVTIPGRCYLLHNDNQLDLFQVARISASLSSTQLPAVPTQHSPTKVADAIIESIKAMYSRDNGRNDGLYYWPDPLPTPDPLRLPDPLVLFQPDDHPDLAQHGRGSVIPLSFHEVLARSKIDQQRPSMQIPLGLIDKPATLQRDTLLVDLHGAGGTVAGGPLLIAGAQHSGKATALQTILFWLTTRYRPHQFRCAVIDPGRDLDIFQALPHLHDNDGNSLWTDGSTDEQITQFTNLFSRIPTQRREKYPDMRWDDDTLPQLWRHGEVVPLLLLIISGYHRFVERTVASAALRKLILSIAEARSLGVYVVLSSTETSPRHIPPDIMGKIGTKIGLFLNEQQQHDLFSRPLSMEPIPGRGYLLTRDHEIHQIQLALPVPGASESLRRQALQYEVQWLTNQL
ncbi:MAG TPA: FtsK/SpoIIIE domain-containing protein [Ktedonobacteraceae bacterium]|nr:FtsK/SpoIIIE domain-containing protein [Ktedonobacteraceae bacterium]